MGWRVALFYCSLTFLFLKSRKEKRWRGRGGEGKRDERRGEKERGGRREEEGGEEEKIEGNKVKKVRI
jgi:hypothetical protein